MRSSRTLTALSVLAFFALPLNGEEPEATGEDALDGILEGFDDETAAESSEAEDTAAARKWELDGSIAFLTSYNYDHDPPASGQADYRGSSSLRGKLALDFDLRLPGEWKARVGGQAFYDAVYSARGRSDYTREALDSCEEEAELNEVYLQGSLSESLDLKVGRQIVVWGKSDNIRVTDLLSPLDRREPGTVDIRYLRLPVTMTRLDYYLGSWDLSGILIHEMRFSKRPAFGSDYFPSASRLPPERRPATTLENTQFAASLSGVFGAWDTAFYLADVWDDKAHTELNAVSLREERRHKRIRMAGAAASLAKGNWLLKAEVAVLHHLQYSATPSHHKTRYDVLAGVEYRGFPDTTISLEAVNRHLAGFEERMADPPDSAEEDEFQSALRLTRDFRHETVHLRYLLSLFDLDGSGGGFQRLWVEYDLNDSVKLTAGLVDYQAGDAPPFNSIGDNDRVFAELRYSF